MSEPGECGTDGLRARKKARVHQEISDVATRLFIEHGFEDVTLAQIAAAADVSVKTIFNHFGSKEDLYFDRAEELWHSLEQTITARGPETSVLQALWTLLAENRVPFVGEGWDGLDDPERYGWFRAFSLTQDRSPALRARRLTLGDELGERLAGLLGCQLGLAPDDPVLRALVAMVVATLHARDRVLRTAVAEQAPPAEVRERVVAFVDTAYERLVAAYSDIDRRA